MVLPILAGVLWILFAIAFVAVIWAILDGDNGTRVFVGVVAVVLLFGALYAQTHTIVPTQSVGISRNSLSQELSQELPPGLQSKPFFGRIYTFPSSTATEYCTQYNPSLKGSYGVNVDLCYYINTENVNWRNEVESTGSLDSNFIWNVWRNSVVSRVAEAIKTYTPEQVSENRDVVEAKIFENVTPWFNDRGVTVSTVSLVNWDFTSDTVAATFDESIVSQRKITEQAALLEAAKLSRERQLYESDTALQVALAQQEMLNNLGFVGQDAINYLWITLYKEQETAPNMVIVPSGVDASISVGP